MESEEIPVVIIVRDHQSHRWAFAGTGAHKIQTPWAEDAPADQVVRWIRLTAKGPITVKVDLSL